MAALGDFIRKRAVVLYGIQFGCLVVGLLIILLAGGKRPSGFWVTVLIVVAFTGGGLKIANDFAGSRYSKPPKQQADQSPGAGTTGMNADNAHYVILQDRPHLPAARRCHQCGQDRGLQLAFPRLAGRTRR